jgi:undecaprenyl-diphosphatase
VIEWIDHLDQHLFLLLNGIGSPYLDSLMLFLSDKYVWIPLYLLIIVQLVFSRRAKFWIPLAYLLIVFTLTDQATSSIMKPLFERLRPCHVIDHNVIVLLTSCGGKYGFASGHAANTMGLAMGLLLIQGKNWLTIILIPWALLVGYSRIYIGVHYPGDVLAGFLVAVIVAFTVYFPVKGLMHKHL